MRYVQILFTAFLLLLQITPSSAQATFQKIYGLPDSNFEATRVSAALNGEVYMSGALTSNTSPNFGALILKLDATGTVVWSNKNISNDQSVLVADIEAAGNTGAICLTNSFASAAIISEVSFINAQGVIQWTKRLENNGDLAMDQISAVTGGFLITGYASGVVNRSLVLKIDQDGNVLWSKQFKNIEIAANAIHEDSNGDLYLPGRANSRGMFLRLKSNGDVVTGKEISYAGIDILGLLTGCTSMGNDSLFLCGYDLNSKVILLKTDLNGNVGSTAVVSKTGSNLYPVGLTRDAQSNVYLTLFDDATGARSLAGKWNNKLEQVWVNYFGNSTAAVSNFYAMSGSKSDGGLLMCGLLQDGPNAPVQTLLSKADADGQIKGACCPQKANLQQQKVAAVATDLDLAEGTSLSLVSDAFELVPAITTEALLCTSEEEIAQTDTLLCPGNCTSFSIINARQGVTYLWKFDGAAPDSSNAVNPSNICYGSKGDFQVALYENGCQLDTATIKVDNPDDLFPNAFAPGGTNKTFAPIIRCPVEEYHLEIFNRWGDLVFESFEPTTVWDGEVNGRPAPMDVYIYRVQYFAIRDGVRQLVYEAKKEVNLLR